MFSPRESLRRCVVVLAAWVCLGMPQGRAEEVKPGVVLTLDDIVNIENWVRYLPVFEKYGARVTFYVDRPDQLTPGQVEGLKALVAAGHEVGCHGWRHLKATEVVKEKGLEVFLQTEIEPAVEALRAVGIEPRTYAYPMSQNSAETDGVLKQLFVKLRTGGPVKAGERLAEKDVFFTPVDAVRERFCLVGKGLDGADEVMLAEQVFPALERAAKRGEVLTLYAHGIEEISKRHHIRPEILEQVLQKAAESGLVFYTMSSLRGGE